MIPKDIAFLTKARPVLENEDSNVSEVTPSKFLT
ncbi:hypothetical protein SAL_1420 [Streptococcus agalactiae 515]|nr:hypothetical protein SAL_1420 [Streptococcus agalactiae 515]